jgi:hypothetical protein
MVNLQNFSRGIKICGGLTALCHSNPQAEWMRAFKEPFQTKGRRSNASRHKGIVAFAYSYFIFRHRSAVRSRR